MVMEVNSIYNILDNFLTLFTDPWYIVALITTFMLGMLINFVLKGYFSDVQKQTQALLIWTSQLTGGPIITIFFVNGEVMKEAMFSGVMTILIFYGLLATADKFKLKWLKNFLTMSFYRD